MELVKKSNEEMQKENKFSAYTWRERQKMPKQPRDYVFNTCPAGKLGMLTGKQDMGKSFLALEIAVSVALGQDITGGAIVVTKSGKVLYLSLEDDLVEMDRRLETMLEYVKVASESDDYLDNIVVAESNTILSLINQAGKANDDAIAELHALAKDMRLVIIDTVAKSHLGDENSTSMTILMQIYADLAKQQGCAVLLIHHPGKGGGNHVRGHSSLLDVRYRIVLKHNKNGNGFVLCNEKNNYGPREKTIELHKNRTNGVFLLKNANNMMKAKTERKETEEVEEKNIETGMVTKW